METIIQRQHEIIESIKKININFKKDSSSRKTLEYLKHKLFCLDKFFDDFQFNHEQLQTIPDKSNEYFTKDIYGQLREYYDSTREMIATYSDNPGPSTSQPQLEPQPVEKLLEQGPPNQKVLELIQMQRTNFRAFKRSVQSCKIEDGADKWEVEDKLRNIQARWNNIDSLHWQIDNILEGSDETYEFEYTSHEIIYENCKKTLNRKLLSTVHVQHSTPQIDIPIFSGNYIQWPTFLDLFTEAIHNNNCLSKAQKMQHLKGKLRGEPERLIQHLNISSDNYDTAWSIINQRYNNEQALFTKQIELFLNQPCIQKQTSIDLKRLHDTSNECINAIQNLGVDTSSWGPLLVHLITKKLDHDTLRDYREWRKSPRTLATFSEIMSFLENKFTALEPISRKFEVASYKPTTSLVPVVKKEYNKPLNTRFPKSSYNRAYHTSIATKCPVCSNTTHALFQCKRFGNMTNSEKRSVLSKYKICNNCLYVHEHNVCNSQKRCKRCFQAHNTMIHDLFSNASHCTQQQHNAQTTVSHVQSDDEILLTTVQLQVQAKDGTYVTLRGLLDQGSQSTLITENAVQRLALQRQHYNANVCGVGTLSNKSRGKVQLTCKSTFDNYTFITEALVMPKLISNLPTHSFVKKNYVHLQNIRLADPCYNICMPIDILFDAKVYSEIIMDGILRGSPEQPIAQQTRLGWILSGTVTKNVNCHVVLNSHEDISKFWQMEEINEHDNEMTESEKFCEDYYTNTTRRLPTGKYEVRLPMKPDFHKYLGASKAKAVAQFKSLEQKFNKNYTLRKDYSKFMEEYRELEHMKECDSSTQSISCYLPHHDIHKHDSSTTKLRVVFNASSKTSTGYSLNDLMETGPKLQQDIQQLLIHWRSYKYVYSADCEKMYRMILLHNDDQQLQKVVWRSSSDEMLREYQLCTLTYGMKASPFLAMRTMKQLARDQATQYPIAAEVLENNFYVDDLLAGSHSIEEAKQVQTHLINMLRSAGFNLRKWCSNTPELLHDLQTDQVDPAFIDFKYDNSTKTLGLRWDAASDSFKFQSKVDIINNQKCITKREMLSHISKIYDPLGWLSPLSIRAKLLFQRVWLMGINWNDTISTDIQHELIQLLEEMKQIDSIDIPRWLGCSKNSIELHGFADASEKVYACAIYLKTRNDNSNSTVTLITAKTKLAPVNKVVTLPRLELCATVLLAKLMKKVLSSVPQQNIKMYGWTDSMITLGWLQGESTRWKSFVANRVRMVTEIIPSSCWNYTKSEENAVDCATRGLNVQQLRNHPLWWHGPEWLKDEDYKPQNLNVITPSLEVKKSKLVNVVHITSQLLHDLLNRYSNWNRATRVLSWVSRFITNARRSDNKIKCNYLTHMEITSARLSFIQVVQQEHFSKEILNLNTNDKISSKSNILSLNPFLDKDNILRVGGRLQNSHLTYNCKHPILIPRNSHLTNLLIDNAHYATLHGGPSLTLTYLRERYWIVGGMRMVKKRLRECIKCRRFNVQRHTQLMAQLPEARVTPSRPFTHTGVDFTGYVDVKASKGRGIKMIKGYIAVFVCFSTKAIHLELVSDLTTPTFLAAFKRFCGRRGVPKYVYSDNGTNFVGASRCLNKEYQVGLLTANTEFLDDINSMGVTWRFNAPLWPSAGGLWEAAVKSVKHHLKRVIGEQKLTYEEFYTLLTQIEACLNSRPLYRLTENIEDGYITPGHFLIGGPLLSSPLSDTRATMSVTTRWQLIEKMHKAFWIKWSKEYLYQLQARYKWNHPTKNLQINDIVLVNEDYMPPSKWALARVNELHPGRDGHVRVVTVKTTNGYLKRPITKLSPLLVESQTEKQANVHKTSSRKRANCLLTLLLLIFSFITPIFTQHIDVTTLPTNNTLYFDKLSDLRIVQDDWKLVMYYNMTSYWQNINCIEQYIRHLRMLCDKEKMFSPIVSQLSNELTELQHFNDVMLYQSNKRTKRGLINGIGYVANTLFGVLDDRFAQRYESDIEIIRANEKHLLNLIKNQTSIMEAENNILKRNEAIMIKQFNFINEHLNNISGEINQIKNATDFVLNSYYVLTTAFSADVIMSHLRRIQETLIDTVTDIYHGQIDIHLLSPNQLQNQLNMIASQLHEELTIPVDDVKDLYKLLSIQAKMTTKYLIMEIRIPLLNRDIFELDRIISLPWISGNKSIYNIPATEYIAFNVRKDSLMPLMESDIQSCMKVKTDVMLCYENHPIYHINMHNSICDMQLKRTINIDNEYYCQPEIRTCGDDWIKLQHRGAWLYSCCQECTVRVLCTAGFVVKKLKGNGILNIPTGCMIKGQKFTIHAQYDYQSEIFMTTDIEKAYNIPYETSMLNNILNSTLPKILLNKIENHSEVFNQISQQVDEIKKQELQPLPSIDSHHIALYTIFFAMIVCAVGYIAFNNRRRWNGSLWRPRTAQNPETTTCPIELHTLRREGSVVGIDRTTSPTLTRTIHFDNLPRP